VLRASYIGRQRTFARSPVRTSGFGGKELFQASLSNSASHGHYVDRKSNQCLREKTDHNPNGPLHLSGIQYQRCRC
jgi:hypothetical protein